MLNLEGTYRQHINKLEQEYKNLLIEAKQGRLTTEEKGLLKEIRGYLDKAAIYSENYLEENSKLETFGQFDPNLLEFVDEVIRQVTEPDDDPEKPNESFLDELLEKKLIEDEVFSDTHENPIRIRTNRKKISWRIGWPFKPFAIGFAILLIVFFVILNINEEQISGSIFNFYSSEGITRTAAISSNGRIIAFQSSDETIVTNDSNKASDIFVLNKDNNTYELVSLDSLGNQANADCSNPSISADGRYIVFESVADNLVPGDLNEESDIFIHDRETGITKRISVAMTGEEGNGGSFRPSISADGNYVIFFSYATNLTTSEVEQSGLLIIHNLQTQENTMLEK